MTTRKFDFKYILTLCLIIILISSNKTYGQNKISDIDSTLALRNLSRKIESITGAAGKSSQYSIAVYSLDDKIYYYTKNIDRSLKPASNTKLYTVFSALEYLGPNFDYPTKVFYDGKINNGLLEGNIYLVGGGDPFLSGSDLDYLADLVLKAGIKNIKGDIVGISSLFDNKSNRKEYSGDRDEVEPIPPVTALSINANTATVLVNSGNTSGSMTNVQTVPSSPVFKINNSSRVSSGAKIQTAKSSKTIQSKQSKPKQKSNNKKSRKSRNRAALEDYQNISSSEYGGSLSKKHKKSRGNFIDAPVARAKAPRICSLPESDGTQKFIVSGNQTPNRTYSYSSFIYYPEITTTAAFYQRLLSGGISIDGKFRNEKFHTYKSFISENSKTEMKQVGVVYRPIRQIIFPLVKNSDNWLAEMIFKSLGGYSCLDCTNTADASRELVSKIMDSTGIDFQGCILNDGSGLSRRNYITARSMIDLLVKASESSFHGTFDSCLTIAGYDGTLRNRMKNTPAERNLRAKTGTHSNISSLAGYVNTQDGERLVFVFLFNGGAVGRYKQIENQLGSLLAGFSFKNSK